MKSRSAELPHDSDDLHLDLACTCFEMAERMARTPQGPSSGDRVMLLLARGAIYHARRAARGDGRLIVAAAWLATRIAELVGDADLCLSFATIADAHCNDLPTHFLGYSADALARASAMCGLIHDARMYRGRALEMVDLLVATASVHAAALHVEIAS